MNRDYLKIGAHFPTGNPYLNIDSRKKFVQKMGTLNYNVEDKVKYCLSLFGWTGEKRPEAQSVFQDMEHYNYYIFRLHAFFWNGLQVFALSMNYEQGVNLQNYILTYFLICLIFMTLSFLRGCKYSKMNY